MLWRDAELRVVQVDEGDYPGYLRVVWNAHVREWSDLAPFSRRRLAEVLFLVEQAVRATLGPDKVNLASLGNMVPHLHWHVIPRFADDAHFPQPIWGLRQRSTAAPVLARRHAAAAGLAARIATGLGAAGAPDP